METSGRALSDLSERELGAVLAVNVRKARLRVFLLDNVVKAREDRWADLSPMPLNQVLNGKEYPAELAEVPLNKLSEPQAASILASNLDRNTLEKLVYDNVVQPEVIESWPLWDSLTDRTAIEDKTALENPLAEVKWRSWVNKDFVTSQLDPRRADITGIRPALYGSLLVIAITMLVAFPVGVGAAIYLEEYAGKSRLNQIIQTNINNLAGVPSIIYGILGLAIFVRALETVTSGNIFGVDTANGRTVLSAGFTLALLILPMIIINAQEAIRAVPNSLRQASYGLGATHWQTIWNHVLPYAMPGILTGTILAISRAIGETAPLILVGGATYLTQDPKGPFSIFTALPLLIYRWTTLPQAEFRNAAAAAIVVLLVLLLTMNSIAVILRNRFSRRLS
ncbi:MAG: phosphate ABC transporter permease PstA [Anaerolineae bacterium]|nr:phosphate ABC transporter permease PstA [Anaerolineae bacterium]